MAEHNGVDDVLVSEKFLNGIGIFIHAPHRLRFRAVAETRQIYVDNSEVVLQQVLN